MVVLIKWEHFCYAREPKGFLTFGFDGAILGLGSVLTCTYGGGGNFFKIQWGNRRGFFFSVGKTDNNLWKIIKVLDPSYFITECFRTLFFFYFRFVLFGSFELGGRWWKRGGGGKFNCISQQILMILGLHDVEIYIQRGWGWIFY